MVKGEYFVVIDVFKFPSTYNLQSKTYDHLKAPQVRPTSHPPSAPATRYSVSSINSASVNIDTPSC